jgi:hypothetical protein
MLTATPSPTAERDQRTVQFETMLAKKLSSHTSECILNDRAITDAEVRILVKALVEHAEAGERQSGVGLGHFVPIAKLDLVGNFISDDGCETLTTFLQSEQSSVTDVDLFGNNVHARGAAALARELKRQGTKLTVLDLRSNPLGVQGEKQLIEVKKSVPSAAVYFDHMPGATGNTGGASLQCPGGCSVS